MNLAFSAFLLLCGLGAIAIIRDTLVKEYRERREPDELYRRACLTRRQQKALERRRANGKVTRPTYSRTSEGREG